MMSSKQVIQVFRVRSLASDGYRTLHYRTDVGSKRSPTKFFDLDQVPDFPGEAAWFEVEPVRKGPWMSVRFLRQVDVLGLPLPPEPDAEVGADSTMSNFKNLKIIYDGRPHHGSWVQDEDKVHVSSAYGGDTGRANKDPLASAERLLRRILDDHYAARRARGDYACLTDHARPTDLPPASGRA
jgi:hypothetical protein